MKVAEARRILLDLELQPEILEKAEEILAGLGDDAELGVDRLDKIMALIDLEVDVAKMETDVCDQTALALGDFLVEVDGAIGEATERVEDLVKSIYDKTERDLKEIKQSKTVVK